MSGTDVIPSRAETVQLGAHYRTVPVSREVAADLDTPVSAFLKLREGGPGFLLESAEGVERIGRYSFVGSRPRGVLVVQDGMCRVNSGKPLPCADPLVAVQALIDAYRPSPPPAAPFEGGALGYLSYEAARSFERLPSAPRDPLGLPDAVFFDVDTVLVFDHLARRARVVAHAHIGDDAGAAWDDAVTRIEGVIERLRSPLPYRDAGWGVRTALSSNMPRGEYERLVSAGRDHIAAGDILQIVMAQRLEVHLPGDPFDLYRRLRVTSPAPYMYFLDFVDHQIVGASPELLVQVRDGIVSTRPIAGTRRRGHTPEEDDALARDLLADEKERAEHLMLVDLARNDVGRVSLPGSVRVPTFMEVERFSHVMHLVSDVEGLLRPECSTLDALRVAFPAGTVSGAPKIRAMQIIAEQETDRRGPYAGAVGFVTPSDALEMAIAIRTGVVSKGILHIGVGAGIVADSVPANEYVETMNKARALLEAAGAAP